MAVANAGNRGMPNLQQLQQPARAALDVVKRNRTYCLTVTSAAICLVSCLVIWSPMFTAIASVPIRVQHQVPTSFDNATLHGLWWVDRDWYKFGLLDIVTTFAYAGFALIAITSIEEAIIALGLVGTLPRPDDLARLAASMCYYVITCAHAIFGIARGHFGIWALWNGYPCAEMPFISKAFLMFQFAFWLQCVFYDNTFKRPGSKSYPQHSEVYFHLMVALITLMAKNTLVPLMMVVLLPHSILCFIDTLAKFCEIAGSNDVLIICLKALYVYVSVAEYIWIMVISCIMCNFGEEMPVALRMFTTKLAVGWGIYKLLRFYYEHVQLQNAAPQQPPVPAPRNRNPPRAPRGGTGRGRN